MPTRRQALSLLSATPFLLDPEMIRFLGGLMPRRRTLMNDRGKLYHRFAPAAGFDYAPWRAFKAQGNDQAYFASDLPPVTTNSSIVTSAPLPPSQREGWGTVATFPAIDPGDVGTLAQEVLLTPAYPQEGSWNDDNNAAYIGTAPDASTTIEIRFTPGLVPQFVDAYFRMLPEPGLLHAGCSFQIYHETGFDFGPFGSGGKVGGGLWGGGRQVSGNDAPWLPTIGGSPGLQDGTSFRNVWGVGSLGVNLRGYAYALNRPTGDGVLSPNVVNQLIPGQWQTIEYEGLININGKADGLGRMWIDGVCISEMTNVIWAIDYEYGFSGIFLSDAWADGTINQSQKRWIRNLTMYAPE